MDSYKKPYKRVLLKLSGEALMGKSQFGIDKKTINSIVEEIKQVYDLGVGFRA